MSELLIDSMPFHYELLEGSGNGKLRVEGIFQRSDVPNANKRIYPRGLWEKQIASPQVSTLIENRGMFGELDHPGDGKTKLQRASHIITDLRLCEDGTVQGVSEILTSVPNGKILDELFNAGTHVGISSRGSGSVSNGTVQEDYRLRTFDFVANPSTPGAFPKVMRESTREKVTNIFQESGAQEVSWDQLFDRMDFSELALEEDMSSLGIKVLSIRKMIIESTGLSDDISLPLLEELRDLRVSVLSQVQQDPSLHPYGRQLLHNIKESISYLTIPNGNDSLTIGTEQEDSMNRRDVIKAHLTEAVEQADTDEQLLEDELSQLSDDQLIQLAHEAGMVDEDDYEDQAELDEDDGLPSYEELLEYALELEEAHVGQASQIEEAGGIIQELTQLVESGEGEGNEEVGLKYEAALGIIQEMASTIELLNEAVGGEDKANALIENYLTSLDNATDTDTGYDAEDGAVNEDILASLEERTSGTLTEDEPINRWAKLAESAVGQLGLN